MHFFINFIKSNIPPQWKQTTTGWISGNCPVCVVNGESRPDTKHRGGFKLSDDEWVYHCFNCKFATGWKSGENITNKTKLLMKQFGVNETELQRVNLGLMKEEETSKLLHPIAQTEIEFSPDWKELQLPEHSKHILDITGDISNKTIKALTMIKDRNLINWTDWYINENDWKFKNRIILPYRYKNKIVGFSARDTSGNDSQIKYIVNRPPHFVFNLDNQSHENKYVIVTEGEYDAININGVAIGTNAISLEQVSIINSLDKIVILVPDADAAGSDLLDAAIKASWFVSFPEWMKECKDVNDAVLKFGRTFVLRSIIDAAIDNPVKIKLLGKRLLK